jgi:hypothetical protein
MGLLSPALSSRRGEGDATKAFDKALNSTAARHAPGPNLSGRTRFSRNFLAVALSNVLTLAKGARVLQIWPRP